MGIEQEWQVLNEECLRGGLQTLERRKNVEGKEVDAQIT